MCNWQLLPYYSNTIDYRGHKPSALYNHNTLKLIVHVLNSFLRCILSGVATSAPTRASAPQLAFLAQASANLLTHVIHNNNHLPCHYIIPWTKIELSLELFCQKQCAMHSNFHLVSSITWSQVIFEGNQRWKKAPIILPCDWLQKLGKANFCQKTTDLSDEYTRILKIIPFNACYHYVVYSELIKMDHCRMWSLQNTAWIASMWKLLLMPTGRQSSTWESLCRASGDFKLAISILKNLAQV